MTDLSREQIESVRVLAQHYDGTEVQLFGVSVRALCDMALRAHDAEQRAQRAEGLARYWKHWAENYAGQAQRAEAECERLRRSLQNVMVHTGHTKTSPDRLHMELLDHIAQIVSNGLATPPPEKRLDEYPTDVASMTRREYMESQGGAPPPEGEPEPDAVLGMRAIGRQFRSAPHTPEQARKCPDCNGSGDKCMGGCSAHPNNWYECPSCGGSGSAPEQAHGDALAAAEESLRFLEGDGYRVSPRLVRHHHDIIRKALTASGVPEDNND